MIYLDYNATTPCAPEVVEAMLPYFSEKFGNAGSVTHALGWVSAEAVKQSRAQIAAKLKCEPEEIYFTSGATEACNTAIQGIFDIYQVKGKEIICIATEHKAVLDTYEFLEKTSGAIVKIIEVDEHGRVNLNALKDSINSNTILISAMFANNETGVINDISDIGTIARANNVLFFCDATQAFGKLPIDLATLPIDALAASAHKIYGPKGVGVLFLRRKKPRVTIQPLIWGGGQEKGKRSGTLNVPGIVGMAKAVSIMGDQEEWNRLKALRDDLENSILALDSKFKINGDPQNRLPHVSNIALIGIKAEKLLSKINHTLCISLGSACAAAQQGPSHVLQAMFDDKERIDGSIRISIGKLTTQTEIQEAKEILIENINKLLIQK